jgi:hypothetical protein
MAKPDPIFAFVTPPEGHDAWDLDRRWAMIFGGSKLNFLSHGLEPDAV